MAIRKSLLLCATVAAAFSVTVGKELPSCEVDVGAKCLNEGADMSAEGIRSCLEGLAERTTPCNEYLTLLKACSVDIGFEGICASDHAEGDTIPCLLQRTKPEQLSPDCQAALPVEEVLEGLKYTLWKNGKRHLEEDEVESLNEEDTETYNRWVKRKSKGKNSAAGQDRQYAIDKMKQQKTRTKLGKEMAAKIAIEAQAFYKAGKPTKEIKKKIKYAAQKAIRRAEKKDDKLGSFSSDDLGDIINNALKMAKAGRDKQKHNHNDEL